MVVLGGGVGFCNALRRVIMSDLQAWAPKEVLIRDNTSCQTDEYIAHRIGMVPFVKVGNGDTMSLRAMGPTTITAGDVVGPAFSAVHDNIEIIVLGEGQTIDLTITFDCKKASVHARYATCAAVGMERVDGEGRHRFHVESVHDRCVREMLREGLDALEARIDKALHELAHQPATPPKSMC